MVLFSARQKVINTLPSVQQLTKSENNIMEPRLLSYNQRRRCQVQARRWRIWSELTLGMLYHEGQAALARQFGVHRSAICRDMKAWWEWVRETRGERL
jgi:hypothetical protein